MLMVGKKVPDFEAQAYFPVEGTMEKVKLSDYEGQWTLLCFYPADFTFVCPTEINAVARVYSELQKLNVEVLAVSTDTVFSHKVWHENSDLIKPVKFPMLADPKGEVCRLYEVYDDGEGLAVRGRFLIDPDGILRAVEVVYPNVGRNVKELLRQIKAFQYVREHPDEIAPAGWEPGKKTFKPGFSIAGKVYQIWKPEE
jgi:peroxiredoxin